MNLLLAILCSIYFLSSYEASANEIEVKKLGGPEIFSYQFFFAKEKIIQKLSLVSESEYDSLLSLEKKCEKITIDLQDDLNKKRNDLIVINIKDFLQTERLKKNKMKVTLLCMNYVEPAKP